MPVTFDSNDLLQSWPGWGINSFEYFPDPFMDMASTYMPRSNASVLRWCEYIFMSNGIYRQAVDRLLSYFITDIKIENVSDDDRDKWQTFLNDIIDIKNLLHIIGLDLMCYGNSFISVIPAFKKYLICPNCPKNNDYFEIALSSIDEDQMPLHWSNYKFIGKCPKCKTVVTWNMEDRKINDEKLLRVKRWSPHEIELLYSFVNDKTKFVWKIPNYIKDRLSRGNIFHIDNTPNEIIEAIAKDENFEFYDDAVFHLKEDALAGVNNFGWGVSKILTNFRQVWYVQVLHRYNEAIALDYVIPFRLITPVPGNPQTGVDVYSNLDMGSFMSQVRAMLSRRRRDPASWFTLPFPVQYQVLGGDARAFAPRELLEFGIETLLASNGIPIELYRGTLQLQSAPVSLRLLETTHASIPHNLNNLLKYLSRRIATLMNWELPKVYLDKVSHSDDIMRHHAKLQLMLTGLVSPSTGLKSVGVDYKEEIKRMIEDQKIQAKEQVKAQQELEQLSNIQSLSQQETQQIQSGMQAPVVPGQGQPTYGTETGGVMATTTPTTTQSGQTTQDQQATQPTPADSVMAQMGNSPIKPTTPEELLRQAYAIASSVLQLPESLKDSKLIELKKRDPTLHALVKSIINDIRTKARTIGGAVLLSQMFRSPNM